MKKRQSSCFDINIFFQSDCWNIFILQQFAQIDNTPEDEYDNYGDYDPSLKTDTIVFDYIEDGKDGVGNIDASGDLVANLGPMASKVFDKLCLGKLKLEFSTSIHSVKYVSQFSKYQV